MDIIVTIQFTYGGVFLSDPDLRVNKKGYYYKLENNVDVLSLISSLKYGEFVDVYVVHQISEPILVNDDVAATPPLLQLSNGDVTAPVEPDRADVFSSHPLNINEDEYINENQSPRAEKGKAKVSCEDLGEGQFNDFSIYHLQTSDSELDFDWTDSGGDSLYDVDENIEELSDFDEELLQVKKTNIEKQAKEKADRVNVDEIPSGPVDIDASFKDICKNKGVRYEGKMGEDDPYFDSSYPGSDISDEEEGDPVDDDEVVDPLPRTSSSKIYFDKTAKKQQKACRPSNAQSAPTCSGRPANAHNAPTATGRHANAASVGGVRPARASTADIRPATAVMPTTTSAVGATATQSTTQLSTSGVGTQKRKTSTALRGGANLTYKRPRQKKKKEASFDVLFGPSGSMVERSGNTNRVLHNPTPISSVPTNIDLGFKPNGLRWKGGAAITQRQLQQQSSKRSKAKSSPTTQAISSTQTSKNQSTTSTQATH
ncbi:hypothetical protein T459_21851 [Capsicum annuum]|uniref:Uncharacterized protein n=1 Tax=Capsicum annuum TaxID=4072 RepID=A0A2G2YXV1_CAPAN|nr:hypothetical protein T459_21851 [Capsicum annuum]